MTCSQCRNSIVIDEMSEVERITCPSCGTEVHVRVGAVAEPTRPIAPPPVMMPVPMRPVAAPPRVAPVAPVFMPPLRGPLEPQPIRTLARPSPAPPVVAPMLAPRAPRSSSRPAPDGPRRSCPACGEKMALEAARCDACGANYQRALRVARGEPATDDPSALADNKSDMEAGVVGGVAAMIIAVVWFVVRYQANRFSFYAIFLFVFGVVGLTDGAARMRRKQRNARSRGRSRSSIDPTRGGDAGSRR